MTIPHPRGHTRVYALIASIAVTSAGSVALLAQSDRQKQAPISAEQIQQAQALSGAFKQVAKAVSPAVVNIQVTQQGPQMQMQDQRPMPFEDDLFRRFRDEVSAAAESDVTIEVLYFEYFRRNHELVELIVRSRSTSTAAFRRGWRSAGKRSTSGPGASGCARACGFTTAISSTPTRSPSTSIAWRG